MLLCVCVCVQDREAHCKARYDQVTADGEKIHRLVSENLELFKVNYSMHASCTTTYSVHVHVSYHNKIIQCHVLS